MAGANAGLAGLNPAVATLSLPFGGAANRIAGDSAATCNATDTSRLRAGPGRGQGRTGHFNLAVSASTNTVYAPGVRLAS